MSITDVVLTSICFITLARAVFNLLISLVVSSSSITTTSSPCLWRIQTDWGRGSTRSISSTSSSSAVARGTTGGLHGRTVGPTMPCDTSRSVVCPSGTTGFTAPDFGASPATPASALEDPVVPIVALVLLPIHPLSTLLVRHRQVHKQRWLTPPSVAELSGTLGRELSMLPPAWDQPSVV